MASPKLDLSNVRPGLTGTASLVVAAEHTAPRVGSGRIAVLATPVMINVIEAAALAAMEHLLPAGYQSLGIRLDVRHFAATPVGLTVTATPDDADYIVTYGRRIQMHRWGPSLERYFAANPPVYTVWINGIEYVHIHPGPRRGRAP